jgi:hypothetical protein
MRSFDLGTLTELTGTASIDSIHLEGTNGSSRLKVKVSGKGAAGHANMSGSVTGSSILGVLSAPRLGINGGIRMTGEGVIRSVNVRRVNRIEMPGDRFSQGVKVVAQKISKDVTLGSPLRLMNVGTLASVNLTAPRAQRVLVRGDYLGGSMSLTDEATDFSLGLLSIGRHMRDVSIRAASSVDTIRASDMTRCGVVVGNDAGLLGPASSADDLARRGALLHLNVAGGVFCDSYVSAWRIGSVSLDDAEHGDAELPFGLTYHRLRRYDGPRNVGRTVI